MAEGLRGAATRVRWWQAGGEAPSLRWRGGGGGWGQGEANGRWVSSDRQGEAPSPTQGIERPPGPGSRGQVGRQARGAGFTDPCCPDYQSQQRGILPGPPCRA